MPIGSIIDIRNKELYHILLQDVVVAMLHNTKSRYKINRANRQSHFLKWRSSFRCGVCQTKFHDPRSGHYHDDDHINIPNNLKM